MCSWERLHGSEIIHIHVCLISTALVPSSSYVTEQGICQCLILQLVSDLSFHSLVARFSDGCWMHVSFCCVRKPMPRYICGGRTELASFS